MFFQGNLSNVDVTWGEKLTMLLWFQCFCMVNQILIDILLWNDPQRWRNMVYRCHPSYFEVVRRYQIQQIAWFSYATYTKTTIRVQRCIVVLNVAYRGLCCIKMTVLSGYQWNLSQYLVAQMGILVSNLRLFCVWHCIPIFAMENSFLFVYILHCTQ